MRRWSRRLMVSVTALAVAGGTYLGAVGIASAEDEVLPPRYIVALTGTVTVNDNNTIGSDDDPCTYHMHATARWVEGPDGPDVTGDRWASPDCADAHAQADILIDSVADGVARIRFIAWANGGCESVFGCDLDGETIDRPFPFTLEIGKRTEVPLIEWEDGWKKVSFKPVLMFVDERTL